MLVVFQEARTGSAEDEEASYWYRSEYLEVENHFGGWEMGVEGC